MVTPARVTRVMYTLDHRFPSSHPHHLLSIKWQLLIKPNCISTDWTQLPRCKDRVKKALMLEDRTESLALGMSGTHSLSLREASNAERGRGEGAVGGRARFVKAGDTAGWSEGRH